METGKMKKNIVFIIVIALVISVVGLARTSPGWANALGLPSPVAERAQPLTLNELGDPSQQFDAIPVTENGIYYLGGICTFEVEYKKTGLRDDADIEVPVEFSRTIPYKAPNELSVLLIPGCHFVHFKEDKVVDAVSSEDGQWTVCFGERPDVDLVIYYYLDSSLSKKWIPLPTSHHDGLACASAWYTGEYAPAHEPYIDTGPDGGAGNGSGNNAIPGSILPPSNSTVITHSGSYSVGGICSLIVEYKKDNIEDHVHVQDPFNEDPVDWDTNLPFPTENGLLFQPGCHVLHYEDGEIVRWEQTTNEDGKWTICFAARPDKEMTIYYYLGDLTEYASPWIPLETTVEYGRACAPAQYTGMYTPGGRDK
jgi:hypothetical protein